MSQSMVRLDGRPASGATSGSGRACTRCGCNLSRYAGPCNCNPNKPCTCTCMPCGRTIRQEAEARFPRFAPDSTEDPTEFHDWDAEAAAWARAKERHKRIERKTLCACGEMKHRDSAMCRACRYKEQASAELAAKRVCPECGNEKGDRAQRCRACEYKRRSAATTCACGNPKSGIRFATCADCRLEARRQLPPSPRRVCACGATKTPRAQTCAECRRKHRRAA